MSATRSNEPSSNGSADASPTWKPTRPASSGGVFARACSTISAERSTPTTSASGKRRATANVATPVPLPTSSARFGGGTSASACSRA